MKKVLWVILVLVCFVLLYSDAKGQTRNVSSYAASGMPRHAVSIQNATGWTCRIMENAAESIVLKPGESVVNDPRPPSWKKASSWIPFAKQDGDEIGTYARSATLWLPFIAICRDANDQYAGMAKTVIEITGGGASSESSWIIRNEDVRMIQGEHPRVALVPENVQTRTVIFKRWHVAEGTTILLLGNNSKEPATITITGHTDVIRTGDTLVVLLRHAALGTATVVRDGKMLTYTFSVGEQWGNVYGIPIILDPGDFH